MEMAEYREVLNKSVPVRIFNWICAKGGYAFACLVFASLCTWIGICYVYFSYMGAVPDWNFEEYKKEFYFIYTVVVCSNIFLIYILGGFYKLGINTYIGPINLANRKLGGINFFKEPVSNAEVAELLQNFYSLQSYIMKICTILYAVNIVLYGAYTFYLKRDIMEIVRAAGIVIPCVLIFSGFIYLTMDTLFALTRVFLKKEILSRKISMPPDMPGMSMKFKFMFLLTTIFVSIFNMAAFVSSAKRPLFMIALYILLSIVSCGLLLFFFFLQIDTTLKQINESASDLAKGGDGHLPMISRDEEFVIFALNYEIAVAEVKDIRTNLEKKVREKTSELSKALDLTQRLKEQQDGDYFLTTLLLEPLNVFESDSRYVSIESFIHQKKVFDFKGRQKEIGGDLNFSCQIELQGEKYTFAVNADAMGKSMQGAGGVLVFGASLRSIIERTRVSPEMQHYSPEFWLKNMIEEVHRLFLSFDGSMLISLFTALIHESSGFTLYTCAEHPEGVLYRDGKASFLKVNSNFMKIGVTMDQEDLKLDHILLRNGDTLVMGSDGRDDILIADPSTGETELNLNEHLFLEHVEKAEASLEKIFENIISAGEQTDDISLLKISYNTHKKQIPVPEDTYSDLKAVTEKSISGAGSRSALRDSIDSILSQFGNHFAVKKFLAKELIHQNEYGLALELSESGVLENPNDNTLLFLSAYSAFKTGIYRKTLSYAYRLHYRTDSSVDNTLLICRTYHKMSDYHSLFDFTSKVVYTDKYTNEDVMKYHKYAHARLQEENV